MSSAHECHRPSGSGSDHSVCACPRLVYLGPRGDGAPRPWWLTLMLMPWAVRSWRRASHASSRGCLSSRCCCWASPVAFPLASANCRTLSRNRTSSSTTLWRAAWLPSPGTNYTQGNTVVSEAGKRLCLGWGAQHVLPGLGPWPLSTLLACMPGSPGRAPRCHPRPWEGGVPGRPGGWARSCECTDVITKSRKVHAIPTNGTESVPSNQILKTA